MSNNVTMVCPATLGGEITGTPSGTLYQVSANQSISVVQADIPTFLALGFTMYPGTVTQNLPLSRAKLANGQPAGTAAVTTAPGLVLTPGTAVALVGLTAITSTATTNIFFEEDISSLYAAGTNINVIVDAQMVGSGTASVSTVALSNFNIMSDVGTASANLVTGTTVGTLTTAAAAYTFTATGANVSPSNRFTMELQTVLTETGGSATVKAQINSIKVVL